MGSIHPVVNLVVTIALVALSIVIHEVSHGWVAYKLGDPTAKAAGRLTLNPLKHIDPFGTILLPALMAFSGGPAFGYAKPVPYNPSYFKDIRKGEFLTAMAGPMSNLLQALVGAAIAWIVVFLFDHTSKLFIYQVIYYFASTYIYVNLILMFFNLIPLPPLDGSAIIAPFLSDKQLNTYYKIQGYSIFILLAVFFLVPMVFHVNPIGIYLNATAGNLYDLLLPV